MEATSPPYELQVDQSTVVVTLHPQIVDVQWAEIETFGADAVSALENTKAPGCMIDLSPLNYMGSAMVALIVRLWKVVKSRNGNMVVVCADPNVKQVITLAGLDKVWTVVPDRKTGQQKLGSRSKILDDPAAQQPLGLTSGGGASPAGRTFPWGYVFLALLIGAGLAAAGFLLKDRLQPPAQENSVETEDGTTEESQPDDAIEEAASTESGGSDAPDDESVTAEADTDSVEESTEQPTTAEESSNSSN